MEMPKLTEQHRKLEALVGDWVGQETMHPSPWDPKGGKATSRSTSRLELDGFFLISDYVQQREGQVSYKGHGVFGWDTRQERYTMHWFDAMGCDPGPPALGTWEGNKLGFQHQHPMGHSRYTYEFVRDGEYCFTLEHSQDGQSWMKFIEGDYKRVS